MIERTAKALTFCLVSALCLAMCGFLFFLLLPLAQTGHVRCIVFMAALVSACTAGVFGQAARAVITGRGWSFP